MFWAEDVHRIWGWGHVEMGNVTMELTMTTIMILVTIVTAVIFACLMEGTHLYEGQMVVMLVGIRRRNMDPVSTGDLWSRRINLP